jgi:hypothetical protein
MAAPKPTDYPDFATAENFPVDASNPQSGLATKIAIAADLVLYGNKRGAVYPPDNRAFNAWMNLVGLWVRFFDEDKSQQYFEVTGTTHTLQAVDAWKDHYCTAATAVAITLPKDITQNLPIGSVTPIRWKGVGQPSVVAEDGTVTVESSGGELKIARQHGRIYVEKTAANTYFISGEKSA